MADHSPCVHRCPQQLVSAFYPRLVQFLLELHTLTVAKFASVPSRIAPSPAWLQSWHSKLALPPLLTALDALKAHPRARVGAALPAPGPLQVRRYQPSEESLRWMQLVAFGLLYQRNAGAPEGLHREDAQLFDARAVRLVQILAEEVVEEEEDDDD